MNNVAKKFLTGIMCAGLAAFCVLPVSASHMHNYVDKPNANPSKRVKSYNEAQHDLEVTYPQECRICGIAGARTAIVTESHNLIFTEIFDEPGIFHYNVRCTICGFNYNK